MAPPYITQSLSSIIPVDELEQRHLDDARRWLNSGKPIYRISKPDNPPKHLVSYFVVYDHVHRFTHKLERCVTE